MYLGAVKIGALPCAQTSLPHSACTGQTDPFKATSIMRSPYSAIPSGFLIPRQTPAVAHGCLKVKPLPTSSLLFPPSPLEASLPAALPAPTPACAFSALVSPPCSLEG